MLSPWAQKASRDSLNLISGQPIHSWACPQTRNVSSPKLLRSSLLIPGKRLKPQPFGAGTWSWRLHQKIQGSFHPVNYPTSHWISLQSIGPVESLLRSPLAGRHAWSSPPGPHRRACARRKASHARADRWFLTDVDASGGSTGQRVNGTHQASSRGQAHEQLSKTGSIPPAGPACLLGLLVCGGS